ncbi:hypothetical protein K438DRAFT_1647035, partial [Mycena galopus ATCC 62051]
LVLVRVRVRLGPAAWISSGNSAVFGAIEDPYTNVVIEIHQYFDSDSSGSSSAGVSSTIGAE